MFIPYGLLILGYFLGSVRPSPAASVEAGAAAGPLPDTAQTPDYEYNDDEDTAADEMRAKAGATHAGSTAMPAFAVNETRVFFKPGGPLKLDCPVQNFDDSMMILWFHGNNTITNGKQPLSDLYKVDDSFSLVMERTSNQTAGSYYCRVMPPNVALHIALVQGEAPPTVPPQPEKEAGPANRAQGVRPLDRGLGLGVGLALAGLLQRKLSLLARF